MRQSKSTSSRGCTKRVVGYDEELQVSLMENQNAGEDNKNKDSKNRKWRIYQRRKKKFYLGRVWTNFESYLHFNSNYDILMVWYTTKFGRLQIQIVRSRICSIWNVQLWIISGSHSIVSAPSNHCASKRVTDRGIEDCHVIVNIDWFRWF